MFLIIGAGVGAGCLSLPVWVHLRTTNLRVMNAPGPQDRGRPAEQAQYGMLK